MCVNVCNRFVLMNVFCNSEVKVDGCYGAKNDYSQEKNLPRSVCGLNFVHIADGNWKLALGSILLTMPF